jgi:succinoglycan biosynthesis protein ExoM
MTPSVAVCILTLERPLGLRRALEGVAALDAAGASVHVVVVDNDPAGSAAATVDAMRDALPYPIQYVVEPQRGIPYGRNRAVRTARELGATHLAFVDDDEVPEPGWLRAHLAEVARSEADAVMGPVVSVFEEPPPPWVLAGGFFDRKRRPTGAPMHYGTTSNVLVVMDAFGEDDAPFAEWMGLSGGDDTHFFMRLLLGGGRIVWCDEAVVSETVPPSRVSVPWLLRRRYRHGNTLSLCLRDLQDSPYRRVRRLVGGFERMVTGALLALVSLPRGRSHVVAALQRAWFGAGQLSGLVGRRYDEYRVIHGG